MSEAFILAVRRCLHPDQHIPSPEKPSVPPPLRSQRRRAVHAESSIAQTSSQNLSGTGNTSRKRPATCRQESGPTASSVGTESDLTTDTKRRKKVTKKPKSATAERGAKYRPHPSRAVLDRHVRSLRHRLFLIERKDEDIETINTDDSNHIEEGEQQQGSQRKHRGATFAVMGSNGNVYECRVAVQPSCTCPDFLKRTNTSGSGPCKHLIFVFNRILKVDKEDPIWWQSRLLSDEVHRILSNLPTTNDDDYMANEGVRSMYRATELRKERESQLSIERRKPVEGDCPICFEDLKDADESRPEDVTTFCENCGNNFHKACVQNWVRVRGQSQASCPLCRSAMNNMREVSSDAAAAATGDGSTERVYTNLSQFSTHHERSLTLAEMYADTHQYIGRGGGNGGR